MGQHHAQDLPWQARLIQSIATIMNLTELKQKVGKPTVPIIRGEPTTSQELASYICHVTHGAEGESWPVKGHGFPMQPLAQIVFGELPVVPAHLSDLEMVAVFIDPAVVDMGLRNGQGWLLRAYSKGQKLVPLTTPPIDEPSQARSLQWGGAITDMPPSPDYVSEVYHDSLEDFYERTEFDDICSRSLKVGGYPRHLQWDIHFCDTVPNEEQIAEFGVSFCDTRLPNPAEPAFAFQIASMTELDLCFMDMGIFYFGRGSGQHADEWFAQIEGH